jgi:putative transcriptional regulator
MKNKVREARTRKGWTQLDLADAVNATTACVNAVEHGRFDPSLILACDIGEARISSRSSRRSSEDRLKTTPPRSHGIWAVFRSPEEIFAAQLSRHILEVLS